MDWFKRIKEGITTKTSQKKEMADGLWIKCPKCKVITSRDDLIKLNNSFVVDGEFMNLTVQIRGKDFRDTAFFSWDAY